MGLKAKFNLVMLGAFIIGLGLAAAVSYTIVNDNARREVLQNARIMLASALAIRGYTVSEIEPLLAAQSKVTFLPHTIPSFAAQTNFKRVQQSFPDYLYKEAALNPTNPTDRATDWETDLIRAFQQQPNLAEQVTERDTPAGPTLNLSRPFRLTNQACLTCHSVPAAAPASMIAVYGTANGFGWKLGDVIGAQVVTVPMEVALKKANEVFFLILGGLAVVFLVMIVLLNLLLHYVIIRPVRRISKMASDVSLGNADVPEYAVRGKDEIASLGTSFNRMRRSLTNAMSMLEAGD